MRALHLLPTCLLVVTAARSFGELPSVQVESVRRVFHNGEHNAFTDMCRFRGRCYLTFRSCPDGHLSGSLENRSVGPRE